jgi:PadR family transcriptional regulator, regulatory protein PadR
VRRGSAARRLYRATPAGRNALNAAKLKVRELFGELFEDQPPNRRT